MCRMDAVTYTLQGRKRGDEMKREEQTIEHLKRLRSFHNGSYGADINKAIKAIEQLTSYEQTINKLTKAIAEEKQATPDLLVLRSPFFMKKEDANKVYEHFLKQKNRGMVILEAGWDCLLVPDDVKIRMEQNPWEIIINPMEELKNKIEAYYADCSLSIAEADEECKRCNDTVFGSILKMMDDAIEEQKERKAAWINKTRL